MIGICKRCGVEKELKTRSNGKIGSHCRLCHNEFCRESNKNRKVKIAETLKKKRYVVRDYITAKKTNVPCTDCGIIYPSYVLDFDHVRGDKEICISLIANSHWSLKRIDEELAKCDLVCSNCHRVRTFNRASLWIYRPNE